MRNTRMLGVALVFVVFAAVAPAGFAACDDYTCPEYAHGDLENMLGSIGRLPDQYPTSTDALRFREKAHEIYLRDLVEQLQDPTHPAITAAALIPGGMIGDIDTWPTYEDWIASGRAKPVRFRRSTGALIRGHVWRPALELPGPFPAISITPGSVQAPEPAYWWAAELLAEAGYVVLTFDAQGQGRSETFGHEDDGSESITFDGFPFQQELNFHEATVEAVEFLLSTPAAPNPYAFEADAADGYDVYQPVLVTHRVPAGRVREPRARRAFLRRERRHARAGPRAQPDELAAHPDDRRVGQPEPGLHAARPGDGPERGVVHRAVVQPAAARSRGEEVCVQRLA